MNEELLSEFFIDTQAHLESIEDALLKFEKDSSRMELIDDVFRGVHSVKGNAGMLGLMDIHTVGQSFESFLGQIRERKSATPDEIDNMFHSLDALKEAVAGVKGEKGEEDTQEQEKEAREHTPQEPPADAIYGQAPAPEKAEGAEPDHAEDAPAAPAPRPDEKQERKESPPPRRTQENVTFLTFELAGEKYGIQIMNVREIILMDAITPVPNSKPFVAGVMNLRDQVIPVFDLKRKLEFQEEGSGNEKNIIVVDVDKVTTGLKVDEVTGIMNFQSDKITTPEMFRGNIPTDYLYGMGQSSDGAIILLDAGELCDPDEILYETKEH